MEIIIVVCAHDLNTKLTSLDIHTKLNITDGIIIVLIMTLRHCR